MARIEVLDAIADNQLLDDDAIMAHRKVCLGRLAQQADDGSGWLEVFQGAVDLCDLALAGNILARQRVTRSVRAGAEARVSCNKTN